MTLNPSNPDPSRMSPSEALRNLDETIREKSILEHPFYQAWNKGMLTKDQLATCPHLLCARRGVSELPGGGRDESQQPDVSHTKASGLRAFYGVEDAKTLEYFTVHEAADVRHRAGEREALAACLVAGVPVHVIQDAASQALDAYWGLLDGVCSEIGLSC